MLTVRQAIGLLFGVVAVLSGVFTAGIKLGERFALSAIDDEQCQRYCSSIYGDDDDLVVEPSVCSKSIIMDSISWMDADNVYSFPMDAEAVYVRLPWIGAESYDYHLFLQDREEVFLSFDHDCPVDIRPLKYFYIYGARLPPYLLLRVENTERNLREEIEWHTIQESYVPIGDISPDILENVDRVTLGVTRDLIKRHPEAFRNANKYFTISIVDIGFRANKVN